MRTPRHPWGQTPKGGDPGTSPTAENHAAPPGLLGKPFISLVLYLTCLGVGICIAVGFIVPSIDVRYPYGNDTAGYLEQAAELLAGHIPMATPWGIRPYTVELAPSENHPPGYPILIAIVSRLFKVDPATAGLSVTRACWAASFPVIVYGLIPSFGLLPAIVVASLALASPSFYEFGFGALSDLPFFFFSTLSLAFLFRALVGDRGYLLPLLSGVLAGLAYAIRNSGMATLVGVAAGMTFTLVARLIPLRRGARITGWWSAGAVLGLLPTIAYNIAFFGAPIPYHVDPSTTYPPIVSIRVYLADLLLDLTALKPIATLAWSKWGFALILVPLAGYFAWRLVTRFRGLPSHSRTTVVILGSVIGAGSAMVIIAHSYYELDPGYLIRHVMPYSWMVLALVALGLPTARHPRINPWVLAVVTVLLTTRIAYAVIDLRKEVQLQQVLAGHDDIAAAVASADPNVLLTNSLRVAVANDDGLIAAIRALPADAFLVSNSGCLLRLTTGRRVRTVELSRLADTDRFLTQVTEGVPHIPAHRAVYAIVCLTNGIARGDDARHWKDHMREKLPPTIEVEKETPTGLVLRVRGTDRERPVPATGA